MSNKFNMRIDENLVAFNIEASTDQEAIDILANTMLKQGVVKESYIEAIKNREKEFSTALQLADMGVAIPHTDACHVNEASIAIGILDKPVEFSHMGMPEIKVPVEVMIMLGITEPHAQLELLQKLMEIFQVEGRLTALKACETKKAVIDTFLSYLND